MPEKLVRGDLEAFSIFDVAQSLMTGRKDACVILERGNKKGYLYFEAGQIVAAVDDNLTGGNAAAMHLFAWRSGAFTIDFSAQSPGKNITVPTDYLMLEVARNLDEVKRDHKETGDSLTETEAEKEASGRLDSALAQKLHTAFSRVADEARPGRSIYSPQCFDPLLESLREHGGSALFLEAGSCPRIRCAEAFVQASDEEVTPTELEGFLQSVLSEREWALLRDQREVGGCYQSPTLGSFRVHVAQEWGRHLVTFSPTGHETPPLGELCPEPLAVALPQLDSGLVVVAGPVGSGKAMLTASLIQEHVDRSDRFAVVFAASQRYTLSAKSGMGLYRELPQAGITFHVALRSALDQGADIIGVVGALERETFHLALGAAGGNRLVVYTLESHSPMHTLQRLFRWAHTDDGDPLLDTLSRCLRYVVDLQPTSGRPAVASALAVDRDTQEAIRTGAIEILKSKRLASLSPA